MGPFGVCEKGGNMSELVARTGRLQQRYEDGCRLVAGFLSHSHSLFSLLLCLIHMIMIFFLLNRPFFS